MSINLLTQELIAALAKASSLTFPQLAKALVRSQDITRGDFSFPCFMFAKDWKLSPPECANKLAQSIELPPNFERYEIVGPYINFFLKRSNFSTNVLKAILTKKLSIGQESRGDTLILEYSSPNIAKPFHVGHLRNTLIGLSLDRLLRHLGYKVISINHLGDWGTQFGFVWAGCELWGKPEKASVDALVELYRRASLLKKAQEEKQVPEEDANKPDVTEMARQYFKRLESGESEARKFWQWCLDISLEYLKRMYTRLGVHFDHYTGESFYESKLSEIESQIRATGILEDSRGALGVDLGKPLGFVRIFTEDGRSLYMTRDLATADYRVKTFKPSKILHVVGQTQTLYFQQLIGVLKRMQHPAAELLIHVGYGQVPGIGTRAGNTEKISLKELLDEAHERALTAYQSSVVKHPDGLDQDELAEKVGLGAICFEFLSRSNIKEFYFKWEDALNFQGDTGPYLQYALARINSIETKAKEAGITLGAEIESALLPGPGAYKLVSWLADFESVLSRAAADYEPYLIALYLLELAKLFSSAYKDLRVVGEDLKLAQARLALFVATKYVLQTGLTLIGVPPIERM